MADKEPNNPTSGGEGLSDNAPEENNRKRSRSIDPKTGALRILEDHTSFTTQADLLDGKKRIYHSYLRPGNNEYELHDKVNEFEREIHIDEDGHFGVQILNISDEFPEVSISYQDTCRWRGIWINVEPHSNSDLVSLPEEERVSALVARSPKKNLEDLLSFYNTEGTKAFNPLYHETEEQVAETNELVDKWLRDNFTSEYQFFTEAERARLATEARESIKKFAGDFLEEPLGDAEHDKKFIDLLARRMLIRPELPKNILSLTPEERQEKYFVALYAAAIRMLDWKYGQMAEAGHYMVTILSSKEGDTSDVTIYTDNNNKETYKFGDKMRKEEYEYTVTESEDGIRLLIKNILKPETIQIKFPPNGLDIVKIREVVKSDDWIKYSELIPTEVAVE